MFERAAVIDATRAAIADPTDTAQVFRRGRRARWLPSVDWVSMLPRPLADARAALEVVPVGDYEQVRELHRPFLWRDRDHNQ